MTNNRGRPKAGSALLLEWSRSCQRARFPGEHIEIVFELQHLLLPAVTLFMPSHAGSVMPQFDAIGIGFRLHLCSGF
jgi:hypothetical protein